MSDQEKEPTRETNKKFASNEAFIKACEAAKVTPTQRQASKFRNQKGAAWKEYKRSVQQRWDDDYTKS